jgi:hypothetical protein
MSEAEFDTKCREERCEDGSILVRDADDTKIAHIFPSNPALNSVWPGQMGAYRRYLNERVERNTDKEIEELATEHCEAFRTLADIGDQLRLVKSHLRGLRTRIGDLVV